MQVPRLTSEVATGAMLRRLQPAVRRVVLVALSMGGVAFTSLILWIGYRSGQFGGPNDYSVTFDVVGDMLRSGQNPYSTGLVYSPPLTLVFAAISWLPVPIASGLVLAAEIAALRYITGSWIGTGLAGWCPLLAFELPLGNVNLVLGACIVAAVRGHGWGGVAGGLIKLSPVIAIREWRTALFAAGVAVLVTLPWLWMWGDSVRNLLAALRVDNVGVTIVPVPLSVRVVVGLGLLAVRRPWATALAAVVTIPAFHYQTLLLMIVPVAVWLRREDSESRPARPPSASVREPFPWRRAHRLAVPGGRRYPGSTVWASRDCR